MGGVSTCTTGCSKNNPDFLTVEQKRNMKKKKGKLNIEATASMSSKMESNN